MSKIATYSLADTPLQLSDRLIGTEAPRPTPSATPLATKNFSLGELLNLFSSNFPAATLQAVLNAGNTATQNITLTGTIDTTLIRPDNIEDTSGSQGTVFQFLSKGASSINWVDLPVDNLQAVLNAGNTATQSITLIGNITSTRIIPGNIQDDTTGIGTTGQFLSKTASGIRWVNAPASTTPGLGDVLSVNNTAINNINLTGNVTATSFIKTGGTNLQYLMADGSVTTGGGIPTLQQVLDNNHDLVNSNNFQGTGAGISNTGAQVNAFGFNAARENIGQSINALGVNTCYQNTGDAVNALGDSAAQNNTGIFVNALGQDSANANTGTQVNALGTEAAIENAGGSVNALGNAAAGFNSGSNVNALGDNAGYENTANHVNALGYSAARSNSGDQVNAFGTDACFENLGGLVNAFGTEAGYQNTGNNSNFLGEQAGEFNTGEGVNAMGAAAGLNNTFNGVNLFGQSATADEDGQTVLSKDGTIMARISTIDLTATRKYNLPDADGTLALLSDIPSGGVTSVGLTMPSAFSVTNSPITSSGDIAVTGAGLVSQYVRGDGTLANFPNSTGGGSSVNYYLNGSVSQGTFGGDTYYQMSKTPILGAGTNFIRTNGAGNGYIASFITDAGDPSFLNIPGGNWNVEFYFQSSASGGSPQFYAEIYKVSATNVFTLVASGSANPEGITNGTTIDQYFTSIPVPQTSLLITDRLAVRIYVITGGRTITLHTENGNLCEVLTTFTTGLTALNGLTQQVQYFAVGTSGTDFAISSATDTHTFNLPTASAANRGALSSADWTTFNNKQAALGFTPENVTNKQTDLTASATKYPTVNAVNTGLALRQRKLFNLTPQVTHTGTTVKTIIATYFIPANTFTAGDFLIFNALVTKVANISSTTHTIEINTTNTLTGAQILSTAALNTTSFTMKFKREIVLQGGIENRVLQVNSTTPNDNIVGLTTTVLTQFTYNLAADLYFFVTCTLTNSLDSITYRGIKITD